MPAEFDPEARQLRGRIVLLFCYRATESNSRPSSASLIQGSTAAVDTGA